jgi:hypothetical protein
LRDKSTLEIRERSYSWNSPLVLAIIASAIGLIGNAVVAVGNWETATKKSADDLRMETLKQQSTLVLERIKTGDVDRARANLQLIAKPKLLGNKEMEAAILEATQPGPNILSPSLPAPVANQSPPICQNEPAPYAIRQGEFEGYAYYEVSKDGSLTNQGVLQPLGPSIMPDFSGIKVGDRFKATGSVYLRQNPNGCHGWTTGMDIVGIITASGCVETVPHDMRPIEVQVARSGGFLPVKRVPCPN